MLLRITVPLLLWAAFYIFASIVQARAERRAAEAEPPAEVSDTEPPEDALLAA